MFIFHEHTSNLGVYREACKFEGLLVTRYHENRLKVKKVCDLSRRRAIDKRSFVMPHPVTATARDIEFLQSEVLKNTCLLAEAE